jgi:alkaline phosphatase D
MLGDQIYADVVESNGLGKIPLNVNDYRKVYETTWKNPHHRALLMQTPAFMILDDHEIDNDWHWTDKRFQTTDISTLTRILRWLGGRPKEELHLSATRVKAGLKANWEHQAIHAPVILSPSGPLAYEFEYGKAAFFIMDTRTQRVQNGQDTQLLGEKQWKMLETWLLRVNNTHTAKFIVSSISVLTDFLVDPTGDRWGGFKHERERLLGFIAEHGIKGIHFLVGDLHSAHAVSADVIAENGELFEIKQFCSSPFEQKTSVWTLAFDWLAKSKFLKNKKLHSPVAKINYGIVNVDFSDKKSPKVTFDLHYKDGNIWKVNSR